LGWPSGTLLRVDVAHRRLVLEADVRGVTAVGVRGLIGLPAAARRTCGIEAGSIVLLAALILHQTLVIHPAAEVVRLLRHTHTRILGSRHAG
jgi:hypothetical protein